MPSRWQREYTCSRCAAYLSGLGHARVMAWSPIARAQGTLYRLCDRCLDALRDWINSATFTELWTVEPQS